MQLTTNTSEGVTVLRIEGSLDTQTSSEAQEELDRIVDDGARKLLIDFAELAYISSAGLRVLLVTAKKLNTEQGEMRMCNMNDVVKEVFEVSGFSTIFKVFQTDSEAMAGF
jgi:anti-anti-sigma factor